MGWSGIHQQHQRLFSLFLQVFGLQLEMVRDNDVFHLNIVRLVFGNQPHIGVYRSFFGVTIILLHQETGVPIDTGWMMPRSTSKSKSALTCFFQWYGTGIGTWCACGVASSFRWMWAGMVSMAGRAPDLLKTVLLKFSIR